MSQTLSEGQLLRRQKCPWSLIYLGDNFTLSRTDNHFVEINDLPASLCSQSEMHNHSVGSCRIAAKKVSAASFTPDSRHVVFADKGGDVYAVEVSKGSDSITGDPSPYPTTCKTPQYDFRLVLDFNYILSPQNLFASLPHSQYSGHQLCSTWVTEPCLRA